MAVMDCAMRSSSGKRTLREVAWFRRTRSHSMVTSWTWEALPAVSLPYDERRKVRLLHCSRHTLRTSEPKRDCT